MTAPENDQREVLVARLGFRDAYFLVIGSVFGTGIFFTSGLMAAECPSPPLLLGLWIAGGLFTLLGALTFAELGSMFPRAGGPYAYLLEGYGKLAAYLYGWGFFWIVGCGGVAALAAGLAESLVPFGAHWADGSPLVTIAAGPLRFPISGRQLTAAAAIVLVTAVNRLGVRTGIRAQNGLVLARLAGLSLFIVFGLVAAVKAGFGPDSALARWGHVGAVPLSGLSAAFLAVLWTYDGWYAASCTAEEIRDPRRVLPRALGLGVLTLMVFYVLANVVYLLALPPAALKGTVGVGAAAAAGLFGPTGARLFAGLIVVSALGCLSANILFCARVPFAMARDGLFWKPLRRLDPKTQAPAAALAAQMAVAVLLGLTGSYQALYEYVVFALTFFFAATALAVPILRHTRPDVPRPYRVWGYPIVPLLFAALNGVIFVFSAAARPAQAAISAGILALGVPAYFVWLKGSHEPV
jgi:APA family basic amino acid/polyamine antiporter